MNKMKLGCALLLVASLGSSVYANDYYVKATGGINKPDADMNNGNSIGFDNGGIFNLSIGKKFNAFDVELEYSYGTHDWENKTTNVKGEGKEKGIFINGYYNLNLDSKVTPYIGAGIGRLKYNDGYSSETKKSYQGMIGAAYAINEKVDLNVEYRYRKADYSTMDLSSDNYIAGIKYKF